MTFQECWAETHILNLSVGNNNFFSPHFFSCRHLRKKEEDVYNFGFILLESLLGPFFSGKGETFLLNEMVWDF